MTEKSLICVSCPVGCEITVCVEGNEVVQVEGSRCLRGDTYARQEAVEPMRVLPTSVKVMNGEYPLVCVKTERPVPKRLIPEIMELIRSLSVEAPVKIGQVLIKNISGTGVDLVATRAVHRA